MIIIGLTGGIASGKSTIARQFRVLGAAVYDADRAVHFLLAAGGAAVEAVGRVFPKARQNNFIDRRILASLVFGNPEALGVLERILHPLVQKEERIFIKKARAMGKKIVVLEIPLLFETAGDERCDITVLADVPPFLQRQRALSRPSMTDATLKAILARQMPHMHKRKLADVKIPTGLGKAYSFCKAKEILLSLQHSGKHHA